MGWLGVGLDHQIFGHVISIAKVAGMNVQIVIKNHVRRMYNKGDKIMLCGCSLSTDETYLGLIGPNFLPGLTDMTKNVSLH